jgi:ribonuclease P protein component
MPITSESAAGPASALRKARRLRSDLEFQRVRRLGQSYAHPLLVLWVAPSVEGDATRVGITVGRRVGGAVVRNRVRRRIREAVRLRYHALPAGWDLVFVAREESAEAGGQDLVRAVASLLRRSGLLETRCGAAEGRGQP